METQMDDTVESRGKESWELWQAIWTFMGVGACVAFIAFMTMKTPGWRAAHHSEEYEFHSGEYEFAKNAGDRPEACKHVGPLINLSRTTRNAEEYKKWVTVRDGYCVNYPTSE